MNRFSKLLFNAFRRDYGRLDDITYANTSYKRNRLYKWVSAELKLMEARLK